MPLTGSWWLGKKKGHEAYIVPGVVRDDDTAAGHRVTFTVGRDIANSPTAKGTVGRAGAVCIACGTAVELKYIRAEGRSGRIGAQLMAMVAEGDRRRIYLPPNTDHVEAARVPGPKSVPEERLAYMPRDIKAPTYGMAKFSDLFTNRQLTLMTTLSDLILDIRAQVLRDALAAGMDGGSRLVDGGHGGAAYADAIATYLGFVMSKVAARNNTMCTRPARRASPSRRASTTCASTSALRSTVSHKGDHL